MRRTKEWWGQGWTGMNELSWSTWSVRGTALVVSVATCLMIVVSAPDVASLLWVAAFAATVSIGSNHSERRVMGRVDDDYTRSTGKYECQVCDSARI